MVGVSISGRVSVPVHSYCLASVLRLWSFCIQRSGENYLFFMGEMSSLETELAKPRFRKLEREGSGHPVTMRSVFRFFSRVTFTPTAWVGLSLFS